MNSPLRLALIGTGRWGSVIKKTLETIEGCVLAYEATRDWEALLTTDDIDGVIIATPPSTHVDIALAFIAKGIPVFIEKPMTLSSSEGARIVEASERTGVPVLVGHIHLFNGAFSALKELVPKYGGAKHIETEASNFGPYRPDYSVIWDYASHDVSMVLDLLQELPVTVSATAQAYADRATRNWDLSDVHLSFPSGITTHMRSSRISPAKVRRVTVLCERATLVYDDTLPEQKLAVYEQVTPQALQELGAGKVVLSPTYPKYDPAPPLTNELTAFLNTIATRKTSSSDASLGARVVDVLVAIEHSIGTDEPTAEIG